MALDLTLEKNHEINVELSGCPMNLRDEGESIVELSGCPMNLRDEGESIVGCPMNLRDEGESIVELSGCPMNLRDEGESIFELSGCPMNLRDEGESILELSGCPMNLRDEGESIFELSECPSNLRDKGESIFEPSGCPRNLRDEGESIFEPSGCPMNLRDEREDPRNTNLPQSSKKGNSEAAGSSAGPLRSFAVKQLQSPEDEYDGGEEFTGDYIRYLPLFKATLKGEWTSTKRFLDRHPEAATAPITHYLETVMHIAVGNRNNVDFFKELLECMPAKALELQDKNGDTSLVNAAIARNTKAAEMLVRKNSNLPQLRNNIGKTPLHISAECGHRAMTKYLLSVTRNNYPSPFSGKSGVVLLNYVIIAGIYDVALHLVQCYPSLATTKVRGVNTPLYTLSRMPHAFPSGTQPSFWQRLIYKCVPIKLDNEPLFPIRSDTENPTQASVESTQMSNWLRLVRGIQISSVRQSLNIGIWQAIKQLGVKQIQDKKLMHLQTIQLVKSICAEIVGIKNSSESMKLLQLPILNAASNGIHEIVTEIVQAYPSAIWHVNKERCNIFHLAVLNRQVKVFNLIYQMCSYENIFLESYDTSGNNVLHMVAKLAPSPQLNSVAGAALQMQRELQWYEEVEKIVQPSNIEMTDKKGRTPKMIFTEEHENLVKEGEKWMKDTATSCMVVATLIATVVFTAAFTVPGGNNDHGIPIFLQNKYFIVFAIADALSLFSSTTSVLMFLSILTSRYAEEDFLRSLPKRLIIGLATLFLSITTMMIAFSATLSIVVGQKIAWVAISVFLLAFVPITIFVLLHFPLLIDIVLSTYGRSIFHKQNRDIIY